MAHVLLTTSTLTPLESWTLVIGSMLLALIIVLLITRRLRSTSSTHDHGSIGPRYLEQLRREHGNPHQDGRGER